MITTVHLAIHWAKGTGPRLTEVPLEHLSIRDPRVLLGVQQVLARRRGVTQAPDLVSASGIPYFVVSLNDRPEDRAVANRYVITTLLGDITDPIQLRIAFAADGGWKVVLADLELEVI